MSDVEVSVVLIELKPGRTSIALRYGQSHTLQVLEEWEDLDPEAATQIEADIVRGKIPYSELANKPYREVTLPADC